MVTKLLLTIYVILLDTPVRFIALAKVVHSDSSSQLPISNKPQGM
jgi:multisubunit Na+/H+ antiporter MnhG subunit